MRFKIEGSLQVTFVIDRQIEADSGESACRAVIKAVEEMVTKTDVAITDWDLTASPTESIA